MSKQYLFYSLLVVLEPMLFIVLVGLIRQGQRCASGACALSISPGLPIVAVMIEDRSLAQVINLDLLPWSLAIGDPLLIPLAAVVAASAYRAHPEPFRAVWTWSWWLIGLAVGTLFYFVLDGPAYAAVGRSAALLSPTKMMHDFVVMPALWGGMFCACLLLLRRATWHRYVLVACFVGWATLVVVDGQRGLDLTQLHPLWDEVHFRRMAIVHQDSLNFIRVLPSWNVSYFQLVA